MKLRPYFIIAATLVLGLAITHAIRKTLFDFVRVANESMLPYLVPGQAVVLARFAPCIHLPFPETGVFCSPCTPGRAYVFRHPKNAEHRLIKFAVSEEQFRRGSAQLQTGDIISFTVQAAPSLVPETGLHSGAPACYFVGSNAEHSVDSRNFGAVPAASVEGLVIFPWRLTKHKHD